MEGTVAGLIRVYNYWQDERREAYVLLLLLESVTATQKIICWLSSINGMVYVLFHRFQIKTIIDLSIKTQLINMTTLHGNTALVFNGNQLWITYRALKIVSILQLHLTVALWLFWFAASVIVKCITIVSSIDIVSSLHQLLKWFFAFIISGTTFHYASISTECLYNIELWRNLKCTSWNWSQFTPHECSVQRDWDS